MNQKERLERSIRWGNNVTIVAVAFASLVLIDYGFNGVIDEINPNYTIAYLVASAAVGVAGQALARKAHRYRFHRKYAN